MSGANQADTVELRCADGKPGYQGAARRKSGFEQVGFPINTALQRGGKPSPTHPTVSTVFFCRNPNRPGSR
jgi:hypothetical protein